MTFGVGTAAPDSLSLAVALHQAPGHFPELLRGRGALPAGIDILLRLAGGASLEDEEFVSPPLLPIGELRKAARFFIEQVLLSRDADHYRVLGVGHDASLDEIKENHRLLMRIFHPDRAEGSSAADDEIAARINLAYNALRLPADRAAYDAKLRQAPKAATIVHPPTVGPRPMDPEPRKPLLSPFVVRHLPQLVLGAVAMVAALGVGLVYVTRQPVTAIGGGEGRTEPVSEAMKLAMRGEPSAPSAANMSHAQPTTPRPAPHAAKVAVAHEKPDESRPPKPAPSGSESRRMAIDDEPASVRPPARGETGEIAPIEKPAPAVEPAKQPVRLAANRPAAQEPKPASSAPKAPELHMAKTLPSSPAVEPPAPSEPSSEPQAPQPSPSTPQAVVASAPIQPQVEPASTAPVLQAAAPQPAPVLVSAAVPARASLAAATTAPTPTPAPAPAPRQITPADLTTLVASLSSIYARGDIDAFLALFSDDAHIEDGGKERIRSDYLALFQSTAARQLYVWDMKWTSADGVYRGQGNYQAKVVRKGEDSARVYDGVLKLEVVPVNGAPRVRALLH